MQNKGENKMNKNFGVYHMRKGDIPAVANLFNKLVYNQLSRDKYYEEETDHLLYIESTSYFKETFNNANKSIFVAKYNSKVIAFLEILFCEKDFYFNIENYVYCIHLFVDKDIKTNINPLLIISELYRACEGEALNKGYRYIGGDIFEFNIQMQSVIKFLGFKPYKTRYIKKIK